MARQDPTHIQDKALVSDYMKIRNILLHMRIVFHYLYAHLYLIFYFIIDLFMHYPLYTYSSSYLFHTYAMHKHTCICISMSRKIELLIKT